jgi:hypothetical protein
VMRWPRESSGPEGSWISTELSRKIQLVMKRKRPKLVVLDPKDFSEIALAKCAQRCQDRLDIAAGRRTPEEVQRENSWLIRNPRQFVTTNLRDASERL